jgi:membrane-bound lytic murein transglycosylase B
MTAAPFTRRSKAITVVPVALLSAAWSVSLLTNSAAVGAATGHRHDPLPDGTTVPQQAIQAPASVPIPGQLGMGVPKGSADAVVAGATTSGIPAPALAAYQRAAQIIDSADKQCNIPWELIAAIGRVESNHGRYGGNALDSNGVSRPGIYGIPLNGGNDTQNIGDTDAGQYDHDTKTDRAVGPMQFIPSTWSVVGVDGDGDGKRNPQDIDDAALGTAVYLCSGNEDLSTSKGQRSAVYRYNHSQEYVDLVLSIMRAYASGDFSSVPTSTGGTTTFTPDFGDSVMASGVTGYHYPRSSSKGGGGSRGSSGGSSSSSSGAPKSSTTTGGSTASAPSGGGSTPNLTGSGGGSASDPTAPVKKATDGVKDATGGATGTVTNTVTPLQTATTYCQNNVSAVQLTALGGIDKCTSAYLNGGAAAVTNLINSLPSVGGVTGGGGVLP